MREKPVVMKMTRKPSSVIIATLFRLGAVTHAPHFSSLGKKQHVSSRVAAKIESSTCIALSPQDALGTFCQTITFSPLREEGRGQLGAALLLPESKSSPGCLLSCHWPWVGSMDFSIWNVTHQNAPHQIIQLQCLCRICPESLSEELIETNFPNGEMFIFPFIMQQSINEITV